MKFKDFIDMYDNWNGLVVINNGNLNMLARDTAVYIADHERYFEYWDMEVVSFGFYDNELCVRVK